MSRSKGQRRGSPGANLELQTLEPRLLLSTAASPDLAVNVLETGMTFPKSPVPGDRGAVAVVVANDGAAAAIGTVKVSAFLSPHHSLSTDGTLIGSRQLAVSLAPGKQVTVMVPVTIADMSSGTKWVIGQVTAIRMDPESNTSNNVDTAATNVNLQRSFGAVPGRQGSTMLTLTNPATGHPVTFSLTGPGTATVSSDFHIAVTGSTSATIISIRPQGNELLRVRDVAVVGGLGDFLAPNVDLAGDFSVHTGSVQFISLDTMTGGTLSVPRNLIRLDAAQLTGGAAIKADTIQMVNVIGRSNQTTVPAKFDASLLAHDTQGFSTAITQVRVLGNASGSIITEHGGIRQVIVTGSMQNLAIFSASDIGTVQAGAMQGSAVVAGSSRYHETVAPGSTAKINSIVVTGAAAQHGVGFGNSVIGAGTVVMAKIIGVNPNNSAGGGAMKTNMLPNVLHEEGIFVRQRVGVVVVSEAGGPLKTFTQTSVDPVILPNFFIRML